MKILLLTFILGIWSVFPTTDTNYKFFYNNELKTSKWVGCTDPNYSWDGDRLSYERMVKDENGKDVLIKTYCNPIEIIADFKPETKVYGIKGKIEEVAVKKFGGSLKGFIWLDNISGSGEVTLPFTAPHIFMAIGDRLNPKLIEINTDPNADNHYEVVEGKTRVFVRSFSGIGGAAGAPPTLIAYYKMNDNLATDVIIDETGNHNGAVKDATGTATSAFHSVVGKINRAQDFDGTDDYIEIADHDDFTPALTPFSISVWIYMHDATNFVIVSKGIIGTDGEWRFRIDGNKYVEVLFNDENISAYIGREYTTALTENQWLHLVTTYNGGVLSSGIKIYLNSIRVDDANVESGTFVAVENLARPIWIDRYSTSYANGLIDNVMFFSTELTLREVDFLYNYGMGREDFVHMAPLLLGTNF